MTDHNMIPVDQWPEWADRHCWDKRGIGQFIGIQTDKYSWRKWAANSGIPLPAGHAWRVPVMRHQPLAIDPDRIMPSNHEHAAQDLRCQCCGYQTYHREHLGCIRAATPAIDTERVRASVQSLLTWIDDWAETPEESGIEAIAEEAEAVLALIDEQEDDSFPCCGGNDETPREHCMDCLDYPGQPAKGEET